MWYINRLLGVSWPLQRPIACSEIPPFIEVGNFGRDEPPLSITGRIMEYLGRTSIHKMLRNVMRRYVFDVICREQVIPFLGEISGQVSKGVLCGLIHDWGWP